MCLKDKSIPLSVFLQETKKQMSWIDYIILTIILTSAALGLIRGLVQETFSLASWTGALWIGFYYYQTFATQLETLNLKPASLRAAVAFAILFIAAFTLVKIVGYLISTLIDQSLLSGLNRFGGLLFGSARGLLLILILILVADALELSKQSFWQQSRFLPFLERWAQVLAKLNPRDYLSLSSV